jgi:hypothetical protein
VLHRSRAQVLTGLALPALLAACTSLAPSELPLPAGAIEVPAPAVYREWHAKTESCSGRTGDFSTLKFYVVPGVETFSTPDGAKVGAWVSQGESSRIVIAGMYQDHEMVVRHELLHSLLWEEDHPSEYFVNRCRLTWESWNGPLGSSAIASMD